MGAAAPAAAVLTLILLAGPPLVAAEMDPAPTHASDSQRIMGVIPNYQTVSDPRQQFMPI